MKFRNAVAGSALALGALGACATVGTGKVGTGVNNLENVSAVDGGVADGGLDGGVNEGGADAKVPGEGEILYSVTKEELHQRDMQRQCNELERINGQLIEKAVEVESAYPRIMEICVAINNACFEAGGSAVLSLGEQHLEKCQDDADAMACLKNGLREEKDWRALRTIGLITNRCLIGTLECSMELIKNQTPETETGNRTL